jgi:hypothetical protein
MLDVASMDLIAWGEDSVPKKVNGIKRADEIWNDATSAENHEKSLLRRRRLYGFGGGSCFLFSYGHADDAGGQGSALAVIAVGLD